MDHYRVPQDLHIHTTFSSGDSAVLPEQTTDLIAKVRHADIIGISDHFDYLTGNNFLIYKKELQKQGFYVGTEVDGSDWVNEASQYDVDYYIYHCYNATEDYKGAEILLNTGKPVIIAHPYALQTNLNRVPGECFVEINNRYIWRYDWENSLKYFVDKFRFVFSSDAHQPNWLNQNVARYVGKQLGIKESLVFSKKEVLV